MDTRRGPFRLVGQLGSGGMGTVYEVELIEPLDDLVPGHRFAMKVVHAHLASSRRHVELFLREGRLGRSLHHENLVRIVHAGTLSWEADERPYLLSEIVSGHTLREALRTHTVLPEPACRDLAIGLARALDAIHGAGVIHRDVKPENVMLTSSGGIKLCDLGVARLVDETIALSQVGNFAGTVRYSAPEQWSGGRIVPDARADLYALGLVLYEAACGEHPFLEPDFHAYLLRLLHESARPLRDRRPELSPLLAEVVTVLLERDRENRFPSAAELLAALVEGEDSAWWQRAREDRRLLEQRRSWTSEAARLLRDDLGPASSSTTILAGIPAAPLHLFERDEPLARLVANVCARPRRPSVVLGPPGIGKSTLTLAALHDPKVLDAWGQRRFFVRCETLARREGLLGAIGTALGLAPDRWTEEGVSAILREDPALVVLDNFETPWLGQDASAVEALLARLAALPETALVASIRGNEAPGDIAWGEPIRPAVMSLGASRTLFAALAPETTGPEELRDHLLMETGGIPLAVALLGYVAREERALTTLARRWDHERTSLLRRGRGIDRSQNLEVSLRLSLEDPRLRDDAMALPFLSTLALLPAGMAGADLEAWFPSDGLRAVAVLRNMALVHVDDGRLRLLPPIRQFLANERPPTPEAAHAVFDRYLDRLVERAKLHGGKRSRDAVGWWVREHANVERALEGDLRRMGPDRLREVCHAFYALAKDSHHGSPDRLLAVVAEEGRARRDARLEGLVRAWLGDVLVHRGRTREAEKQLLCAIEVLRGSDEVEGRIRALGGLVDCANAHGTLETALQYADEATALSREINDPIGLPENLRRQALLALQMGKGPATASPLLVEARELYRAIGAPIGEANCLSLLGGVALHERHYDEAEALVRQAIVIYQAVGSEIGEAVALRDLGESLLMSGKLDDAHEVLERGCELFQRFGRGDGVMGCRIVLAGVALARSELDLSGTLYQEVLEWAIASQAPLDADALVGLGNIAAAEGREREALARFQDARGRSLARGETYEVGMIELRLASVDAAGGAARAHLRSAREAFSAIGRPDLDARVVEAARALGVDLEGR